MMIISLFDGEQILSAYAKEKFDEGRAEGEKKKALATAKSLFKKGLPAELIACSVELPLAEVNALKAQMPL